MDLRRFCLLIPAALFLIGLGWSPIAAFTRCCQLCGTPSCSKVCRLVCEEKKVSVTCWGVEEEEFCVPGRGVQVCTHCEEVCDCQTEAGEVQSRPKLWSWREWQPCGDPEIRTKRKLMRKTVVKKVPTYKWVLQDLCEECRNAPPADLPPAPAADAKESKSSDTKSKDTAPKESKAADQPQKSAEAKGKAAVGSSRGKD
jgi:hypothetical protein